VNGQFANPSKDSFIWDFKLDDGYLFSFTLVDEDYYYKEVINKKSKNISNPINDNISRNKTNSNNTILNSILENDTFINNSNNTILNLTLENDTFINNSNNTILNSTL